jgi:hypothetical protein
MFFICSENYNTEVAPIEASVNTVPVGREDVEVYLCKGEIERHFGFEGFATKHM